MATFQFDLVSPEKLLLSGEVEQTYVPETVIDGDLRPQATRLLALDGESFDFSGLPASAASSVDVWTYEPSGPQAHSEPGPVTGSVEQMDVQTPGLDDDWNAPLPDAFTYL